MGRSRKVRFVVKMSISSTEPLSFSDGSEWPKHLGRPSDKALATYVAKFEESTLPGGCNEHLGKRVVWSAIVTDTLTSEVKAVYTGPVFTRGVSMPY